MFIFIVICIFNTIIIILVVTLNTWHKLNNFGKIFISTLQINADRKLLYFKERFTTIAAVTIRPGFSGTVPDFGPRFRCSDKPLKSPGFKNILSF